MKWPWQTKPGHIRISAGRLIELQRDALRAADLQASAHAARTQAQAVDTQVRAADLLLEVPVGELDPTTRAQLLDDLPLTTAGDLHEPAFRCLIDEQLWAHRERQYRLLADAPKEM